MQHNLFLAIKNSKGEGEGTEVPYICRNLASENLFRSNHALVDCIYLISQNLIEILLPIILISQVTYFHAAFSCRQSNIHESLTMS